MLDAQDWVATDCYQMLGRTVGVRSTSAAFLDQAERLFRSFPVERGNGDACLDVLFSALVAPAPNVASARAVHSFYRGSGRVGHTTSLWQMYRFLEWQVDSVLGSLVTDRLLLHAGALTRHGQGIILAGPSESGKSTTTTALSLHGYGYLSDEMAVINPDDDLLYPFPKPMSLEDRGPFPEVFNDPDSWFGPEGEPEQGVWYVHPDDVGSGGIGAPSPIGYVLFPTYAPGAAPSITPISRGEAVRGLVENSINFEIMEREGLRTLVRAMTGAQCYRLTTGDLGKTIDLIDSVIR